MVLLWMFTFYLFGDLSALVDCLCAYYLFANVVISVITVCWIGLLRNVVTYIWFGCLTLFVGFVCLGFSYCWVW